MKFLLLAFVTFVIYQTVSARAFYDEREVGLNRSRILSNTCVGEQKLP